MPVYTFHCNKCGKDFEVFVHKVDQVAACPACGDKHPKKVPSLLASLMGKLKSAANSRRCGPRGRSSGFG